MTITAASLFAAIEKRRAELDMTLKDVADQIGAHPALFTRLRKYGAMPNEANRDALLEWLGDPSLAECQTCTELSDDDDDLDEVDPAAAETQDKPTGATVYAIRAVSGRLSESEDPETQSAINRVRELLAEGAVGVSVALDLHPDDSAIIGNAEKAAEADEWSKPFTEYLPTPDWKPRQRVRHTAIVDTPAYADARLVLAEDGSLSGDVTFEGIWTGDARYSADPENIDLEATRVPSPIIWDRTEGDHTGMTVGYIDAFERVAVEGEVAGRPVLDDEAITAALAPMEMPSAYFAQTMPTGPEPLRVSQPDAKGYRAIRGLAAPKGVCHRSSMSCFTFPDDPDPKLRHFHTGTLLHLDDGQDIRVGALTIGGAHLDPALAKAGVKASQVGNHRDDANRVFALVRAWPTRFGLMVAGVIPPDVTEAEVARALACSPSVELWPLGRGQRTLVGMHLVPTPAWPVMASMGSATIATTDEVITLEEATEADDDEAATDSPAETLDAEVAEFDIAEAMKPVIDELQALRAELADVKKVAEATLALTPVPDDLMPE